MSSLDLIRDAFEPVPYPGDDKINACVYGCHDEMQAALTGIDWREFIDHPFDVLGYFNKEPRIKCSRDDFFLLTPEALHYFAPLLVSACLHDAEEADVLFGCLCEILTKEAFLNRLSSGQRRALLAAFWELSGALDYYDKDLQRLLEKLED